MSGARFAGAALDPGTLGFALPYAEYVAASAAAGFEFVEVPCESGLRAGPAALRALLREHGAAPGIFSCPWTAPPNMSVPGDVFAARLARLPEWCAAAAAAGGRRVSVFANGRRPEMVLLERAAIAERCRALAAVASAHGLQLCVELNDPEHLRDAAAILDLAGVPFDALALLLDCYHVYRCALDQRWLSGLPRGCVGWVHLSDVPDEFTPADCESNLRRFPGEGRLDLAAFLHAVAELGYDGPLSLEVLDPALPQQPPAAVAARARRSLSHVLSSAGIALAS